MDPDKGSFPRGNETLRTFKQGSEELLPMVPQSTPQKKWQLKGPAHKGSEPALSRAKEKPEGRGSEFPDDQESYIIYLTPPNLSLTSLSLPPFSYLAVEVLYRLSHREEA